jgi:membrane protease YdiL (CAAX protease family)
VLGLGSVCRAQESSPPEGSPAGTAALGGGFGLVDALAVLLGLISPVVLVLLWRLDLIRPGSPRRWGKRRLAPWPWWVWAIGAFSMFVVMGLGSVLGSLAAASLLVAANMGSSDPTAALGAMGISEGPQAPAMLAGTMLGGSVAGVLFAVAFIRLLRLPGAAGRVEVMRPEGVDLVPRWRDVRIGLLALAAALPVVQGVGMLAAIASYAFTGKAPDPVAHEALRVISGRFGEPGTWVVVFTAVVMGPIAEEFTFRVFVQSALLGVLRRPWAAILASSAFFALIHVGGGLGPEDLHAVAPLMVLGIAMGLAYERTRSPWPPAVMHMAFNGLNVLMMAGSG